jgi:peptidoglycan/xylan/chitin deacetylase (PgdA/CDA1 family)
VVLYVLSMVLIGPRLGPVLRRVGRATWTWQLLGPLVRPPGVIVLTYHRVLAPGLSEAGRGIPVDRFASQMRWLRGHCDPIAPEALLERACHPSRLKPPVLVTFDDGFREYHNLAYPILKELRIPAAVFLVTTLIDQGGMLWTGRVQRAALATRRTAVRLSPEGRAISLPDAASRAAFGLKARNYLKGLPDEERQAVMARLLDELGEPPPPDREFLTWDEVRRTMDLTRFGGHTHTHPILSRLNPAQASLEIQTCRERIAAETGQRPWLFAYPNGRPADYTCHTQALLREHGFSVAFSTSPGVVDAATDWLAVPRIRGEESLAALVSSLWRQ